MRPEDLGNEETRKDVLRDIKDICTVIAVAVIQAHSKNESDKKSFKKTIEGKILVNGILVDGRSSNNESKMHLFSDWYCMVKEAIDHVVEEVNCDIFKLISPGHVCYEFIEMDRQTEKEETTILQEYRTQGTWGSIQKDFFEKIALKDIDKVCGLLIDSNGNPQAAAIMTGLNYAKVQRSDRINSMVERKELSENTKEDSSKLRVPEIKEAEPVVDLEAKINVTELLANLKNKSNGEQQKVQEEEPKAGSSGIVRDDYRQREEIKDLFGKNVELKKEMGKLSEDVKQRQTNQETSLSAINSRQARSECHADSTDKALEALKEKVDSMNYAGEVVTVNDFKCNTAAVAAMEVRMGNMEIMLREIEGLKKCMEELQKGTKRAHDYEAEVLYVAEQAEQGQGKPQKKKK